MTADPAWFADRARLEDGNWLFATYVFETEREPREAAADLCREQSTAQWARPGVTEDFRPRHGAKVVALRTLRSSPAPLHPSPFDGPGPFATAEVVVALPAGNFGANFGMLLTTLLGEGTFFTPGIATIRLTDLQVPDAYANRFPGPQFGVEGLRASFGVKARPFLFGVVKPNVGLDPASFAALAEAAWRGGLDACKDDEQLADAVWSPLAERARLCGEARRRAEAETGEKKIYVSNITDEIARLRPHHDAALAGGANTLMLNALPLGLPAARYVREWARVPLLAHFDMVASVSRAPGFGVESAVLTLLQRMAGFDIILFPGLGARMRSTEAEVRANIEACRRPLGTLRAALPVPGGSSVPGDLAGIRALV
ncbi:MAG: ribulose 1,5-bisphosphate carboxylase, partial [Candidatus Brocadiae bacterium]|nr:ribulose 1,5-bisphosphate carboxylase [Candidatus Brocadiia bacterium]